MKRMIDVIFEREMAQDGTQPREDGVIFVKAAEGNPPEPEFDGT
jgi:hypothetical protein